MKALTFLEYYQETIRNNWNILDKEMNNCNKYFDFVSQPFSIELLRQIFDTYNICDIEGNELKKHIAIRFEYEGKEAEVRVNCFENALGGAMITLQDFMYKEPFNNPLGYRRITPAKNKKHYNQEYCLCPIILDDFFLMLKRSNIEIELKKITVGIAPA